MILPDAIADRRGGILDRDFLTAAIDQHRLVGDRDDAPFAQRARHGIFERLARRFVEDVEDFAQRLAARLARLPAGQILGDRIQVLDAAFGVGRDHGVADRLQRDLRLFLLLEHRGFGALALADVGDRAFVADELAVLVAHGARALDHGQRRAVDASQLELGVAHLAVALERRDDRDAFRRDCDRSFPSAATATRSARTSRPCAPAPD